MSSGTAWDSQRCADHCVLALIASAFEPLSLSDAGHSLWMEYVSRIRSAGANYGSVTFMIIVAAIEVQD